MFDFSHRKNVERKFRQLEALNNLLTERSAEVTQTNQELQNLKEQIVEIHTIYPDLTEKEALTKYFTDLKSQIASSEKEIAQKREELEQILNTLAEAKSLADIKKEKEQLEHQKQELKEYLDLTFEPSDIIFAIYQNMNEANVFINAFYIVVKKEVLDDGSYGVVYQSLFGNQRLGFTQDFADTLFSYKDDDEFSINTTAENYITFADACLKINHSAYLKKRVTALEVDEVLREFMKKYQPRQNEYDEWYFAKKRKVRKIKKADEY